MEPTAEPVAPSAVTLQPGTTRSRFQTGAEQGPIHIRRVEAQDIEFAARVALEAFHDKVEYAVGKSRMDAAIELTTSILHRSPQLWHRYYVALYEGKLAGTMVIKFHDDKLVCMGYALMNTNIGPTQCYVDTVGVDAEFRGKGIGKALMERADVEARQRGCKSLFLWVTQNNRAVRLYERQGYVITHSFGGWFTGWASGCRDWYNMEKNL
ncbi:spermidine/spermine N(1)-acetyltransferase-like isoform X4 [Branchiostoma floridae x Branchiostoma japonicum]